MTTATDHARRRSFQRRAYQLAAGTLCWLFTGLAQAQLQNCDLDGKPVNLDNGSTTAGLTGLIRCRERDSGRLMREKEIRNGAFVGVERFFEGNGARRERTINARGNTDGWARNFGTSGNLLQESFHRDGTRVGLQRVFHPDGRIKSLSHADDAGREQARADFTTRGLLAEFRCGPAPLIDGDAQRCGFGGAPAETETFREDGAKAARLRYEAGRLIAGTWYERDGAIGRSELTQGNERIQRTHHPSGAVRREQVSDLTRRERSAEREFSDSGTKLSEVLWQEGVRASEASWYQNGQPRERIVWSRDGNRRVAQVELFNDAGVRTFSGSRDERSRPMGVHRQFDARGTLRLEQTFDDGGRPVRRREFDENGRLSADDEVFADGSRKAFAR